MKKNLTTICLTLILGLFSWYGASASCNANYSLSTNGNTASLTDLSTGNYYGFRVSWGDGTSKQYGAPNATISHTYSSAGTYGILYEVLDSSLFGNGMCDSLFFSITVTGSTSNCQASFYSYLDTSAAVPNTFVFVSTSTPISAYHSWNFGDGSYGTGTQVSHTYVNGNYYSVSLSLFDSLNNCSSTYTDSVGNGNGPCANLVADAGLNQTISSGVSVSIGGSPTAFGGQAPYTYSWSNGSLLNNSSVSNPTATPVVSSSFNVTVTDANGCQAQDNVSLTVVSSGNCQASFYSYLDTAAANTYIFVSTSTPLSAYHSWNFGDGSYGTGTQVSHTYANSNSYNVMLSLIDSLNNCSSTFTDSTGSGGGPVTPSGCQVSIVPVGNGASFVYNALGLSSNVNSISWDFGDGFSSTGSPAYHTYNSSGSYLVTLMVVSNNYSDTCLSYDTTSVSGGNPCANFQSSIGYTNPASFVANNGFSYTHVTSSNNAPFTYLWSNGSINDSISGLGLGSYCVTITDAIGCTEVNCFTVSAPSQGNCQASFYFYPDTSGAPNTYVFVSTSTPQSAYHNWNFGDGLYGTGTQVSHTYANGANIYNVILTLLDSANNCTSTASDSLIILVTSPTLVWPGDADANGVANIVDLLPIGIGYGTVGPARSNASLSWIGQAAVDFNSTFVNGVDYKHADCDGNGVIDQNDLSAILLNYGLTHNKGDLSLPATMSDAGIRFDISNVNAEAGNTIQIPVELGDANVNAVDIYGITFEVSYDGDLVDAGSVSFDANASWIGTTGSDMLSAGVDLNVAERLDIGLVRLDHNNITGQGVIGTITLTLKSDVSNAADLDLDLSFTNINMINVDQVQTPVNAQNEVITVSGATSVKELDLLSEIRVYPNPATTQLILDLGQVRDDVSIVLIDAIGKQVINQKLQNTNRVEISTSDLNKGIYFLQLEVEGMNITKRVSVVK